MNPSEDILTNTLHRRNFFVVGFVLLILNAAVQELNIVSLNKLESGDRGTNEHNTSFTVQDSLLNDKTVTWDPLVDRLWLDDTGSRERPPAMILLTSYGWNRKNQTKALLEYSRQTRESELLDGIVNHPWFHPTAWTDIQDGNHTLRNILGLDDSNGTITTRFYLFLDQSSDCERHYPTYFSFDKNLDTSGGRINRTWNAVLPAQQTLDHPIWQSKFIQQLESLDQVKLIYFDCSMEMQPDFSAQRKEKGKPVVVAHLTATIARSDETIDMGLVPPLLNKAAALNATEVADIETCAADTDETRRPFYITYIGNYRSGPNGGRFPARYQFTEVHDNKRMFSLRYYKEEFAASSIGNLTYDQILKGSIFSGAPRGDNKYSYRFTEVLASGGIPIVMADDWMWPFRPELVNWEDCAVIIPEKEGGVKMLKYLAAMTLSERCARRQKCYEIYQKYIETGRKVVKGVIDGLELVALGHQKKMPGLHCDPAQPDSNDCNPERRRI
jgi:Exostosin family